MSSQTTTFVDFIRQFLVRGSGCVDLRVRVERLRGDCNDVNRTVLTVIQFGQVLRRYSITPNQRFVERPSLSLAVKRVAVCKQVVIVVVTCIVRRENHTSRLEQSRPWR